MEYLREYGLSDNEIEIVNEYIERMNFDKNIFIYGKEKVIKILDLFLNYGINNIFGIITTNPHIFGGHIDYIKEKLESYENKEELIKLINEDASNLKLLNLC